MSELGRAGATQTQIGAAQALAFLQTSNGPVKAWEVAAHCGLQQPQVSIILNLLLVIGWVQADPAAQREAVPWTWVGPGVGD